MVLRKSLRVGGQCAEPACSRWPYRVSTQRRQPGPLLSAGGLILIAATLAAVITAWKSRLERRSLAGLAFAVLAGLSATAYLVWTVNLKLFIIGHSVEPVEQSRLLTMWYRVNAIRVVTTGCAWIMAAHIGSRLRSDAEKP